MSRIWAVARHMTYESVRSKVALLFIAIIILLLVVLPFQAAGDGLTLKSRVQTFLSWSLSLVGLSLSVLTVLLSCNALASEIRQRQVFMIVSKPIPRWQFFAGKWLGIGMLNAALLAVTAIAVLLATWYLEGREDAGKKDREDLEQDVLTVRHGFKPTEPDWAILVENEIRRRREQGKWDKLSPAEQAKARLTIRNAEKRQWRTLEPSGYPGYLGETQQFVFRDLRVDREEGNVVTLRIKPTHPGGAEDVLFEAMWQSGDPDDPNTWTRAETREFPVKRYGKIKIPARAVNQDGVLYVNLTNRSFKDKIVFDKDDDIELMCGIGTFPGNIVRTVAMIWCRLAFLAAAGLLASSFLSFPVACIGCLLVLAVSSASSWLGDAVRWTAPAGGQDGYWSFGSAVRGATAAFIWLVPDFSKFDGVENVIGGRLVPLMWVLTAFTVLVLVKGLILGIIGCIVFTKRELAQIVV